MRHAGRSLRYYAFFPHQIVSPAPNCLMMFCSHQKRVEWSCRDARVAWMPQRTCVGMYVFADLLCCSYCHWVWVAYICYSIIVFHQDWITVKSQFLARDNKQTQFKQSIRPQQESLMTRLSPRPAEKEIVVAFLGPTLVGLLKAGGGCSKKEGQQLKSSFTLVRLLSNSWMERSIS